MKNYFYKRRKKRFIRKVMSTGLWFVDIPRTGSTSIKYVLTREFGLDYGKSYDRTTCQKFDTFFPDHTDAHSVSLLLGKRNWNSIYSFSFVRNPWDRFYSLYKYRVANGDFERDILFKDYVLSLTTPRYRHIESPYSYAGYHMSMCDYLEDSTGTIQVKDIFRFEERATALSILFDKTGLDFSKEWREATSTDCDYRVQYDSISKAVIEEFYKDDIRRFNYCF